MIWCCFFFLSVIQRPLDTVSLKISRVHSLSLALICVAFMVKHMTGLATWQVQLIVPPLWLVLSIHLPSTSTVLLTASICCEIAWGHKCSNYDGGYRKSIPFFCCAPQASKSFWRSCPKHRLATNVMEHPLLHHFDANPSLHVGSQNQCSRDAPSH